MNKRQRGGQAEQIAADFLKNKGYKILDKNFYTRYGEIDIIAYQRKKKQTVFVEVKARGSNKFGYPEEAVDERKLNKIVKTARVYIDKKHLNNYRFDCLAIDMNYSTRIASIRHYQNIGFNF